MARARSETKLDKIEPILQVVKLSYEQILATRAAANNPQYKDLPFNERAIALGYPALSNAETKAALDKAKADGVVIGEAAISLNYITAEQRSIFKHPIQINS